MSRRRRLGRLLAATAVAYAWLVGAASAQTVQVTQVDTPRIQIAPFGGYRFGGDLYEEITATPLDIDGAPVFGATVDVLIDRGLSFTFLYSHQEARIDVPTLYPTPRSTGGPSTTARVRLSVDHWHAGGTQEFGDGAVRPFLLGTLGLTRFGGADDSELRFSVGAGGGVKLMPSPHVGVHLDGRTFVVLVNGYAASGICSPGACVIGLDVSLAWQVEFTAGVVVAF